jgi:1-acyl-sn-glycerol-3-phosphate acyltransferase
VAAALADPSSASDDASQHEIARFGVAFRIRSRAPGGRESVDLQPHRRNGSVAGPTLGATPEAQRRQVALAWSATGGRVQGAQQHGTGERTPLRVRLVHPLRRLGTGFLFAVFGIGALFVAGVVFPFVAWRSEAGPGRERIAQRLVQRAFAFFVGLGTALRLFELRATGTERLAAAPALVVANHPTLLDVVFLISQMPQADCIVKRDAFHNPFLRHVVRIAGYIPNGDGRDVIDACVARLAAGRSVVLFPEGSRSPETGLRPFKRGVAHIALRSDAPLLPVFLDCDPPALKKGQPWWAVPDRKLVFTLAVDAPVRARDLVPPGELATPLAARAVTAALQRHFDAKAETKRRDAADARQA